MARPVQHDPSEVLEKATQLFWDKGYRGVSVSDLVAKTGLLPGSLYARYGSKEGVYTACVQHYAEVAEGWRRPFEVLPSPMERIRTLFRTMVAQVTSDDGRRGCFLVAASQECDDREPVVTATVAACVERSVQWFARQVEAAVAAGELAPHTDVTTLATSLQTVLSGLQAMARGGVSVAHLPAAASVMVEALLAAAQPQSS
jgi:AcrR family transcriptional regulator